MANSRPTFFDVTREFLRAANIEAEIDDGLAAALVEAGLRVVRSSPAP